MDENSPLVSIGMPVYNGERFIRQALNSLLAQDYENLELIISDNASTDRTAEICQEYAARDPRIRYWHNSENRGAISNFAKVLDMSEGEYFMWAACDDLWEPTYIKTLLQCLTTTPSAVLAFSAFDNVDELGHQVRTYPHLFELPSADLFTRLRNYITQEEHLGKANPIYGLMRRTTIRKAGGFKVWGKGLWGQDMLVVFRLLSLGDLVLSHELLRHKRLTSSLSNSSESGHTSSLPNSAHNRGLALLAARVSSLRSTLRDRRGYFSGYASIISVVDGLTTGQKVRLRAALWARACQVYSREVIRALVWPVAGIVSRVRHLGFSRCV